MTNKLYLSVVSGAIGIAIGAGSMYVGQAGIIRRGIFHSGAPEYTRESSTREIKQQGLENQANRKGTDPDAVYPTKTRP